ncbi:hypothetical protein [Bifidobacterium dolichotidis]|uniref:hypothetical protein n=1 Tax=Bifidobacterium dolichotidis TaxID=2306976 RepID=UPI000F7E61AD|nr:hypothetical protein [Bifidobacterium dolichotidis]
MVSATDIDAPATIQTGEKFRDDPVGCGKKNLTDAKYVTRSIKQEKFPSGGQISVCAAIEIVLIRDRDNRADYIWQVDAAAVYFGLGGLQYSQFEVYVDVPIYAEVAQPDLAHWYVQSSPSYLDEHIQPIGDMTIQNEQIAYSSGTIFKSANYPQYVHELSNTEKFIRLNTSDVSRKKISVDYYHPAIHVMSRAKILNTETRRMTDYEIKTAATLDKK